MIYCRQPKLHITARLPVRQFVLIDVRIDQMYIACSPVFYAWLSGVILNSINSETNLKDGTWQY